jgi:menaquinone-9 beta-reductase
VKPITIIGGGLGGLTLGISLRQRDVPVILLEAGHYPRHRVCGEFISGRGVEVLRQLAVSGTFLADTAAFFSGARVLNHHPLPTPAACVSRFVLDAALAKKFQNAGGELREGQRWRASGAGEGIVWASGRRAHPVENGWRWFGLKIHVRDVPLEADLEMHLGKNSYVGLCQLPGGEVNVCGLFRRRLNDSARGESIEWLRGERGTQLFARLQRASLDEASFCAVAGLSLRPQPIDASECRIGDALTMIPPITGNGMSMAFESAQLAIEPLLNYARGRSSWELAKGEIAGALRGAFTRRLNWAARLHRMIFSPAGAIALPLLIRAAPVWRASFALTR